MMHELRSHEESSFITLTYAPEHLPKDRSLNPKHFQDFMKRVRKRLEPTGKKIRYFHSGEYGEKLFRPHYHAIIFGHSFSERPYLKRTSELGHDSWQSPELDELWPFGRNEVGSVTFESCAYVARYICKKITGAQAESHYTRICETTGEVFTLKPEYATMSKRPGIGADHFKKFSSSIYPSDQCVSRGHPRKPPRFYDKQLEKTDPEMYVFVKEQRECALTLSPKKDRTPDRLRVRETVKLAQIGHLKRNYDNG